MNNIKEFRKLHSFTQTDLALKLGVSKNTVSAWENGLFNPDQENIIKMLVLFDTDFEHLILINDYDRKELLKEMNKRERKEIQNMRLMVEGFGEINKICFEDGSVMGFEYPEEEIEKRYTQILNVLQYVADNLK